MINKHGLKLEDFIGPQVPEWMIVKVVFDLLTLKYLLQMRRDPCVQPIRHFKAATRTTRLSGLDPSRDV